MNKNLVWILAATAAVLASSSSVSAASGAKEMIASREYLAGTWQCHHTVGMFAGDYTTTYKVALGGLWLEQAYDFPATSEGPAIQAHYLIGYDEGRQGWIRFGGHSNGQYFAIRMTDTGNGGWSWKYVSFFPTRMPPSSSADAVFTKKSDSQYTIDGPTYQLNGTGPIVTEHHVCNKG